MFLVLFVLNDAEKLEAILEAWEKIGVPGVTILHSTGLGRARQKPGIWDDLPLMPSLRSLLEHEEFFSRTLFTVVTDEAMVGNLVERAENIVGNLDQPGTGLVVVLPVAKVYGLKKIQKSQ
ncbi:MAG TPA: P-II family nitrogen regulator [Anaerolineales bacterium]|jgi:nitrogen regulatory protein PII|nr:P-II family nitrogen regulator [Anaerolineales bacterium]